MGEECSHNCSQCGQSCEDRKTESLLALQNKNSDIKKVYAVLSGKGGVGKSMITSMLAVQSQRNSHKTAVLDADITGPSIPKIFGIHSNAFGTEDGIIPADTTSGIKLISTNLLLESETEPVLWRGPVLAGVIKQFWTEVQWGDIDYMFVDMPPGTGDVALTVFQSLSIDGIIIVTSPQELVSMIVEKAVIMAEKMNIPIVGIVENMSYFKCPDCGEEHHIFGKSNLEEIASKYNISNTVKLPINPNIAHLSDLGEIEKISDSQLEMLQPLNLF